MIIAIDFDNTIAVDRFPGIGNIRYNAFYAIREMKKMGHYIIINTCRNGEAVENARKFLDYNMVPYDLINENNPDLINKFGDTRKISADIYFDDRNAGGFPGWEWALDLVKHKMTEKPIIFAFIGESGVGKTAACLHLEKKFGISMLRSYTDKPKKRLNDDSHKFLTKEQFDLLSNTLCSGEHGGYRYCTLNDDVRDINSYAITPKGFLELQTQSAFFHIFGIRIYAKKETRLSRGVTIERMNRDIGVDYYSDEVYNKILNNDNDFKSFAYNLNRYIVDVLNKERPFMNFPLEYFTKYPV